MRQFFQHRPFLGSLLLNLALMVGFFSIFYTRFGTTDDVEMQMVLAGKAVLQEPSAYLRWTHIFIGQLLSSLYTYFPTTPWYGLYLCAAHFIGLSAILYSILIHKASLFRIAIFISVFVLGASAMLQELQFTSAALMLGTGAICLLFTAISNPKHASVKLWYVISFSLFLAVTMMRWGSFQLTVVLGTPLLLYGIFQQTEKRWFNLAFCTSILIASWGLNEIHYSIQNQHPGWKEFNTYKKLLAGPDIVDYNKPQYHWTPSSADDYFYKVGWEYEDLMLFRHWFFADSTVYGLEEFQALQATFQSCPYPEEHIEERLWQFFIEFPLEDYVFYGFLILALSCLFIKGNRWLYLLLGSTALLIFSALVGLFVYKHMPNRVSYPMAFYLITLATLFITYDKEIHRKTKFFTLIFLTVIAISNLKKVTLASSNAAFNKMYWTEALDSLNAQPGQLYVGGGDYYMQHLMTPFQNPSDSMFLHFNMVDFGHLANTPTFYKQLENFGIKNVHTEAPLDSNIYLIHQYGAPFLSWYASFIRRHYDMHVSFEAIRHDEELGIAIYAITEQIREETNSQGINLSNMHEFGLELKDPDEIPIDTTKPTATYYEGEEFIMGN